MRASRTLSESSSTTAWDRRDQAKRPRGSQRCAMASVFCALMTLFACAVSTESLDLKGSAKEPGGDDEAWLRVAEAAAAQEAGRDDDAWRIVNEVLRDEPLFVPARRIWSDLLRGRGQVGAIWAELDQLEQRYGKRAEIDYLRIRQIPNARERERAVYEGIKASPDSYWMRYAMAWAMGRLLRQPKARKPARKMLDDLIEIGRPWAEPLLLRNDLERNLTTTRWPRLPDAVALAKRLPMDTRLQLLLYRRGAPGIDSLVRALEGGVSADRVAELLRFPRLRPGHEWAFVRHLDRRPDVRKRLVGVGLGLRLAWMAAARGESELAEQILLESCKQLRPSPSERRGKLLRSGLRELMRLYARRGDIDAAIELYRTRVPRSVIFDGRNRLTARLGAVLDGPCRGLCGPSDDLPRIRSALRVLLEAGWIEECEAFGRFHAARHKDDAQLAALVDEAERFLRFEQGFAEAVSSGSSKKQELSKTLDNLRELSQRIYGHDVVGKPRILDFPMLGGELVDPFGPGLPAFFDRYNRHLIFGRLTGSSIGCILGLKLREARLDSRERMPLLGLCREIVLEEKTISITAGFGIIDPAGVALWNHYFLDLRALRNWVADVWQISDSVRTTGAAAVLDTPFVRTVPALDASRPCQVNWRLIAREVVENDWDWDRLWQEVYDLIRLHEQAHLVDAHRYLPIGNHFGPALWLFAASGFSASSLQADLEGRAEIAALALGANPRLTLAHITAFTTSLHRPGESMHQVGFGRVLRRLIELWQADGAPGAIDPEHNLLAQLDRLDPELAASYANTILDELDF